MKEKKNLKENQGDKAQIKYCNRINIIRIIKNLILNKMKIILKIYKMKKLIIELIMKLINLIQVYKANSYRNIIFKLLMTNKKIFLIKIS